MPQPVVLKGNANVQATQEVDPTNSAARISIRPVEVGAYGSYSVAVVSGAMAAGLAGAAPILAFRFPGTTPPFALGRRVTISAATDATAFVQGSVIFDLITARAFTVQDTGGAAVTMASKSQTRRGTMAAPTALIQASSTATLTAGTRTLDGNPIGAVIGSVGAAPAVVICAETYLLDPAESGRYPLVLSANEGFVVRATVPATGTWKFALAIDWDEVAAF